MNDLRLSILSGVIRHALGWGGAALVSAGYLQPEAVTPVLIDQVAGVIMMLASVAMSMMDKLKAQAQSGVLVAPEPVTPFEKYMPAPATNATKYPEPDETDTPATSFSKPFYLSERSEKNLQGVHPQLADVIRAAIATSPEDYTVIEGLRTRERQLELYNAKPRRTWTLNSMHLIQKDGHGHAVDLAIIEDGKVVDDLSRYAEINNHIKAVAFQAGITGIEWGGNWTQRDGLHWQIKTGDENDK